MFTKLLKLLGLGIILAIFSSTFMVMSLKECQLVVTPSDSSEALLSKHYAIDCRDEKE